MADGLFAAPAHRATRRCSLVCLLAIGGCMQESFAGPGAGLRADGGGAPTPSAYCDALAAGAAPLDDTAQQLLGAPLAFAPTSHGFGLSVVLQAGSPATLGLRVRAAGAQIWGEAAAPAVRAIDLAEWSVEGLAAGLRYEYEVVGCTAMGETGLHAGNVVTQRPAGASFTFALISDTHIGADLRVHEPGRPGDPGRGQRRHRGPHRLISS